MKKKDYKIHIIGSGISGLIAAINLERAGYHPIILERSERIGGRVKTDVIDGYQLDHGFQVLLEAYPMAKKYLDYEALELQDLLPGTVIFNNAKSQTIGDPLRDFNFIWDTLTSSVGSVSDKVKIFNLNRKLKSKSIEDIFKAEEVTTIDYLRELGFSNRIIERFFKPFFSGIFLEANLETSSRMFQFVYKMFGEGLAVIPKNGIGAIADQLYSKLKNTKIEFSSQVAEVRDRELILNDGSSRDTHFTIIATNPNPLVKNLKSQGIKWRSCYNLYFEVEKQLLSKAIIGLVSDKDALINNIFYPQSIETRDKGNHEVLSVTVVKDHKISEEQLINKVKEELAKYCGITDLRLIKLYSIPQALPNLNDLQYDMSETSTQLKPTVFLAGDYLLNGSLNAAMISGERAAQGIIKSLEDGLVVEDLTSEYLN